MSAKINTPTRARGGTRGGCGGGYERTSETFDSDRLRKLRTDFDAMEPQWRDVFLSGLSKFEQAYVKDRRIETPQ